MNNKDFEKKIINNLVAISHEMRTPVNLIASTAKLTNMKIDNANNTEAVKEYMENIMNNCNKISLLIANIMDIDLATVSKKEYVNAKQFFDTFCNNVKPFCRDVDAELKKEFKSDKENIDISIDTTERILLNLVTNAIKYNDKSKKIIKLRMNVKGNKVVFSVKDNGIGISEENIEKVTEKFFRVDQTTASGLGLGLALVKKYLENMGGNMKIKSQLKKGTEFIISIPITPEDKIFTAGENTYVYNPEKSSFNIEFAQITKQGNY